jgi:hypothetical protein
MAGHGEQKPRHVAALGEGSWLAELRRSVNLGRHAEPLTIRVIAPEIDDGRVNNNTF